MAPKRSLSQESGSKQSKIRKFCKFDQEETVEKESPFSWEFYETDDTYIVDDFTRARAAWSDYHEVQMLHFARKTRNGKIKYVSITSYEAFMFVEFLTNILNQINAVEDLGKPGQKLIPFFDDKPKERAYEHEQYNWESFWKYPDLLLPSIRVRVGLNRKTGMYMLFINSPVSSKLSLEFHNWQGPQLVFKLTSMITLLEFVKLSLDSSVSQD